MDLEGYAKRTLKKGESAEALREGLVERILEIKDISRDQAETLAEAVLDEARTTLEITDPLLTTDNSGVSMGNFGVGSRGKGDFYVHEKIAEIIGDTGAVVDSMELDDSGVVRSDGQYMVVTVDGMHSRLSDFPFLAGFHVTRAALRDIYVMGACPIALFSDIHLADDGDVAKIFDYTAGIAAVSDLAGVPLVTGSTLRIGGDLVIGDRLTGCVGAVGTADSITARRDATVGDVVLMSEGAGGGTVSTAALYYGRPEVVLETLNLQFLRACEGLFESDLIERIHAMTDVTNGGIRGDAWEISRTARVKLVFEEGKIRGLVNPAVLSLLEECDIDYLGISLDALLIIAPEDAADGIIEAVASQGVRIDKVGFVEEGAGAELILNGSRQNFEPGFRESAYTPIKKVVDKYHEKSFEEMQQPIDEAVKKSMKKKDDIIALLRDQQNTTNEV